MDVSVFAVDTCGCEAGDDDVCDVQECPGDTKRAVFGVFCRGLGFWARVGHGLG